MDEEIKKILDQQSQDLADIKVQLVKIRRHFVWEQVWSVVRILLIVVPLIVAYIVLMPMLQQALAQYQDLSSSLKNPAGGNNLNLQDLINQYQLK
ncbi:MAG: hypothetical protein V1846_05305 [Candidatus Komeilibacteria bacterium]